MSSKNNSNRIFEKLDQIEQRRLQLVRLMDENEFFNQEKPKNIITIGTSPTRPVLPRKPSNKKNIRTTLAYHVVKFCFKVNELRKNRKL